MTEESQQQTVIAPWRSFCSTMRVDSFTVGLMKATCGAAEVKHVVHGGSALWCVDVLNLYWCHLDGSRSLGGVGLVPLTLLYYRLKVDQWNGSRTPLVGWGLIVGIQWHADVPSPVIISLIFPFLWGRRLDFLCCLPSWSPECWLNHQILMREKTSMDTWAHSFSGGFI